MSILAMAQMNIKRNMKKYIMFVLSLVFSVFTLYTFLALMENEQVNLAFTYDARYRGMLKTFGVVILVFVAFFLISSNSSFIRARKKEISTYALFGMKNSRIGLLLFIETLLVGTTSLLLGIGGGIFFSKLIAMVLLNITLVSFVGDLYFSIAVNAIFYTAAVFLALFSLMGLTGLRVINRFELVDLFKADKLSEGSSQGSYFVLLCSLILMGTGYGIAINPDPSLLAVLAVPILLLVISGTYLFFWGGLPKVLHLLKRNQSRYYKGTNLIAVAAFSHRVKSIGSVMASIAVLSAVATTAIATGYTLYANVENNTYDTVGYDLSYYAYGSSADSLVEEVETVLARQGAEVEGRYLVPLYRARPETEVIRLENRTYYDGSQEQFYFRVYSQSDFNQLIRLSKSRQRPAEIKTGEALYLSAYTGSGVVSAMEGRQLFFSDRTLQVTQVQGFRFAYFGAIHLIVLNDEDFNQLRRSGDLTGGEEGSEAYGLAVVYQIKGALQNKGLNDELVPLLSRQAGGYRTAFNHFSESMETFGLICFIGFFMSGVFILMTASLLYFKQIMAAEEEKHQYQILRKIGMDHQAEKQVITKRLLPVFAIPLLVGILHSIFAMKTADATVFSSLIPVENSYLAVLSFSAVMYGIYAVVYTLFYLITKSQYARIVK